MSPNFIESMTRMMNLKCHHASILLMNRVEKRETELIDSKSQHDWLCSIQLLQALYGANYNAKSSEWRAVLR